ncbi:15247_t:CDS:1 [Racocetra fulgida]|uniref:15247_t:CDS:1 n=1 Tax=Racocetra fulgida TaxID=60492 RepID=A0A9N8WCA4_9GLOM|nr:15247_t:CDS:1 [Racocetra fulgida]
MSTNDNNSYDSTTINKCDVHNDYNGIGKFPALQLINSATFSNQISKSLPSIPYLDNGQIISISSISTASGSRSSSASDSIDTDVSVSYSSTSSVPLTYPENEVEPLNSFGEINNVLKGKNKEIILDINDTLHRPFSSNAPSYDVYEVLAEIKANTLLSYPQYQKRISKSVHLQQQKTNQIFFNKSENTKTHVNDLYVSIKKNTFDFSTNEASTVVIAKYMFWIGWFIMPIWWIGSCYLPRPTSDATPDDYKWRNRCRKASTYGFIGLILGGLFFVIVKSRQL